jgi:hypothetical protein
MYQLQQPPFWLRPPLRSKKAERTEPALFFYFFNKSKERTERTERPEPALFFKVKRAILWLRLAVGIYFARPLVPLKP